MKLPTISISANPAVSVILLSLFLSWFATDSQATPESVGPGIGVLIDDRGPECGELLMNSDASYEQGYCWTTGNYPPDYGAFAECYSGEGEVCGVVLDITDGGGYDAQTMDVFIWSDDEGMPGAILCLRSDVDPGPPALWPSVSRHVIAMPSCCVEGSWWVGYRGNWEKAACGWFVGADLDGPGGCPVTNIPPYWSGLPTGWHDVSVAWGATAALGIGAELVDCSGDTGACCLLEGGCVVVQPGECFEGVFVGEGSLCEPDPCSQIQGACCYESGVCELVLEPSCDGEFSGMGTRCDPNPCPQPGACCFDTGSCVVLQAAECVEDGGGFQGESVSCEPYPCSYPCVDARPLGRSTTITPQPQELPFSNGRRGEDGPNAGGTLLLHAEPDLAYTSDQAPYCGASGLVDCSDAEVRVDHTDPTVFFLFGAFPESAVPRVAGAAFGIEYENCLGILDWGACADFELPTSNWPASESGTALTWDSPRTDTLIEMYWFAGYSYYGLPGRFELRDHPTQGAVFADDSIPSILDPAVALGKLGFYAPGLQACPGQEEIPTGACCASEECFLLTEFQCYLTHGFYEGDGTDCEPSPCSVVPTTETTWGRIKTLFARPKSPRDSR